MKKAIDNGELVAKYDKEAKLEYLQFRKFSNAEVRGNEEGERVIGNKKLSRDQAHSLAAVMSKLKWKFELSKAGAVKLLSSEFKLVISLIVQLLQKPTSFPKLSEPNGTETEAKQKAFGKVSNKVKTKHISSSPCYTAILPSSIECVLKWIPDIGIFSGTKMDAILSLSFR